MDMDDVRPMKNVGYIVTFDQKHKYKLDSGMDSECNG